MEMKKIILDTDIGSDIDDAIALAYLLRQPECELLGVTTVSGDAINRAGMASAICLAAGKPDIPIYAGTEPPLLTPQMQPTAHQAAVLDKWNHAKDFPVGEHIEFMRKTIHKYPNEVTLLAIGPMTNVALLFATDPEIPSLLKELVLMCGIFTYGHIGAYSCLSEWNARCDPYATAIVYNASVKRIRSIGLDVTTQVTMPRGEVMEKFTADVLQPVLDFAGVWFNHTGSITFHDPLAAATIFDDDICKFTRGKVSVETESSKIKGLTYWTPDETGTHEVALGVNAEAFFEHYFSIVK